MLLDVFHIRHVPFATTLELIRGVRGWTVPCDAYSTDGVIPLGFVKTSGSLIRLAVDEAKAVWPRPAAVRPSQRPRFAMTVLVVFSEHQSCNRNS